MRKYRIVEKSDKAGDRQFNPQYKGWWFWHDIHMRPCKSYDHAMSVLRRNKYDYLKKKNKKTAVTVIHDIKESSLKPLRPEDKKVFGASSC